ncbi:MAG: hypothetical protein ACM3SY_14235 [Candidatus Omnitrophota bacterium]
MISKTIIKFHIIQFFRDLSRVAFYLGAFILFTALFVFTRYYAHLESFERFLFNKVFIFNIFICLILSAGILGKEISSGFMNIILAKPVKKSSIYLSKYVATLFFCTLLLLLFLLGIGLITTLYHKQSFPLFSLLPILGVLLLDQISIIGAATFISVWTPREMNVSVMVFLIFIIVFLPNLPGLSLPYFLKQLVDFINPIKSVAIVKNLFAAKPLSFIFFLKYCIYVFLLFTAGIKLFNIKEIGR